MISLSGTTWASARSVRAAATAPGLELCRSDGGGGGRDRRPTLVVRRAAREDDDRAGEPTEGPVDGPRAEGLDTYL